MNLKKISYLGFLCFVTRLKYVINLELYVYDIENKGYIYIYPHFTSNLISIVVVHCLGLLHQFEHHPDWRVLLLVVSNLVFLDS